MKSRETASDMEGAAASLPAPPLTSDCPANAALALLVRRGFQPELAKPDLPFDPNDEALAVPLTAALGHYAFRLFLRGAIQLPEGFAPREATKYVKAPQARALAEQCVGLGLAVRISRGRYRLAKRARSFGGTLEWYVARELRRRLGFEVATGVKFGGNTVGGDLDIVAAADGRLAYLEVKSGPPKHLAETEVCAFLDRLRTLRPDVGVLVLDTSLRLSDKVVPMMVSEITRRDPAAAAPVRLIRELWQLAPQLFTVNAKPDLVANIGRVIAAGFQARAPRFP